MNRLFNEVGEKIMDVTLNCDDVDPVLRDAHWMHRGAHISIRPWVWDIWTLNQMDSWLHRLQKWEKLNNWKYSMPAFATKLRKNGLLCDSLEATRSQSSG